MCSAPNSWKHTDIWKAYRILVTELTGKRSPGRPRAEWMLLLKSVLGMKCEDERYSECLSRGWGGKWGAVEFAQSGLRTAVLSLSVCERSSTEMWRAACCRWQISNRLHVQSISRRGSAWRRVMQRHAPSRYSSGSREAQLYCATAPGHTEHGLWQTDRQYLCLCLFTVLFSTSFGLRLVTTWSLIRIAENCCGSVVFGMRTSVRIFVSLRLCL